MTAAGPPKISVVIPIFGNEGDLPRLVRDSSTDSSGRFIPRIKPLMAVSEKEIAGTWS